MLCTAATHDTRERTATLFNNLASTPRWIMLTDNFSTHRLRLVCREGKRQTTRNDVDENRRGRKSGNGRLKQLLGLYALDEAHICASISASFRRITA